MDPLIRQSGLSPSIFIDALHNQGQCFQYLLVSIDKLAHSLSARALLGSGRLGCLPILQRQRSAYTYCLYQCTDCGKVDLLFDARLLISQERALSSMTQSRCVNDCTRSICCSVPASHTLQIFVVMWRSIAQHTSSL